MSISDYGDTPRPPYDMADDDICPQCHAEPLSRRERVCSACARQNAADIAEVLDIEGAELCPHCERYAVEEREHAEWCPRSSSRPLLSVVAQGPHSAGAIPSRIAVKHLDTLRKWDAEEGAPR